LRVTGVQLNAREWPGVEQEVCSQADTLMLNGFSPLSSIIRKRARMAAKARGVSPPVELYWQRPGFDVCMPLFTRTARFDIQPNRYGILGQFGPDRKLQLVATNVTAIVGMDRRLRPTAYVEMQIYCSNGSHHLSVFEYTKENNLFGLNFRIASPSEGWVPHKWHNIVVQVDDSFYSDPQSTPWENMDRLELYYSAPSPKQRRGDYIRIRNVFLRSTKASSLREHEQLRTRSCRELLQNAIATAARPQSVPLSAASPQSVPSFARLTSTLADSDSQRLVQQRNAVDSSKEPEPALAMSRAEIATTLVWLILFCAPLVGVAIYLC